MHTVHIYYIIRYVSMFFAVDSFVHPFRKQPAVGTSCLWQIVAQCIQVFVTKVREDAKSFFCHCFCEGNPQAASGDSPNTSGAEPRMAPCQA